MNNDAVKLRNMVAHKKYCNYGSTDYKQCVDNLKELQKCLEC